MVEEMEKIRLLDEIDSSKDLLSIPDTLVKILDAVSSDETSQDDIASIILRDPSLTAKVLKMANSSYYSRSGAIKTVHQGIRILGANAIKCIALSVSVFVPPKAKGAIDAATIRQFYFHCIGVGLLARKIAEELQMKNTEEVFIGGLLHDIGKMYMMNAHPVEYLKVKALTDRGVEVIEAERRFFDVDHSELGSVMAARWKLPPDLQRVMRGHHRIEIDPELERTTAIVRLADVLAHSIQTPNLKTMERNREVFSKFEQALKLKREFLDSLAFLLLDETIAVAGSFGIDVGDTTELLNRANRELCKSYLMIEDCSRSDTSFPLSCWKKSASPVCCVPRTLPSQRFLTI